MARKKKFNLVLKNRELYDAFVELPNANLSKNQDNVVEYILKKCNLNENDENIKAQIIARLRAGFFSILGRKMKEQKEKKKGSDFFEQKNSKWLNSTSIISYNLDADVKPKLKRGRPKIESDEFLSSYNNVSKKTQRKIRINTSELLSEDFFIEGCKDIMKKKGNLSGAKMLDNIVNEKSLSPPLKKRKYDETNEIPTSGAVSLLSKAKLTKNSYEAVRKTLEDANVHILPCYTKVWKEKEMSYPSNINATESKCEVPLQELLDHTSIRLLKFLNLVNEQNTETSINDLKELTLLVKGGFDGTTVNIYRQVWMNSNPLYSDDHILFTSMVPLQLIQKDNKQVLWKNATPSSYVLVRPIKLEFVKEDSVVILKEKEYLESQINNLQALTVPGFRIKYEFSLTMLDGKVHSAIAGVSSQKCHLCNATISKFNDLNFINSLKVNSCFLKYGLPILHARIRLLECVLHVCYRLEVKQWRQDANTKLLIEERKKMIQANLRSALNISVDKPKQGFGNTNDGNMARTFFENYKICAKVTGFDSKLLKMIHTITSVIASQHKINVKTFKRYCSNAAKRFVKLYDWYYMPTAVHVLLMHGYLFVNELQLPLGIFSEEAQESSNKIVKHNRTHHARKSSRVHTNLDTIQRMLMTSDPFLQEKTKDKPKKVLTNAMKKLIIIEE